jgi:hypothetical protein
MFRLSSWVNPTTTVTVYDYDHLREEYNRHRRVNADMLIGHWVVKTPLTDSQYRSLPVGLRERVSWPGSARKRA